jgi:CheY-like chemotaxis protein
VPHAQIAGRETNPSPFAFLKTGQTRWNPGNAEPVVFLVEDNPVDVLLVRQSLALHHVRPQLYVARDGDEAIALLAEIDADSLACPDLAILDVNLPRIHGFEVLSRIRASARCGNIPVAMLSSSDAPTDKREAARRGATTYIVKPFDLEGCMSVGEKLKILLTC